MGGIYNEPVLHRRPFDFEIGDWADHVKKMELTPEN